MSASYSYQFSSPSQTDAPSAWVARMALPSAFSYRQHILEDHGALSCALGTEDEVVAACLLAAEDGVDKWLLPSVDVLRLGRVHRAELQSWVLQSQYCLSS